MTVHTLPSVVGWTRMKRSREMFIFSTQCAQRVPFIFTHTHLHSIFAYKLRVSTILQIYLSTGRANRKRLGFQLINTKTLYQYKDEAKVVVARIS